MIGWKRLIILVTIGVLAGLNILIYWNHHLYSVAQKQGNIKERIEILENSLSFYPFNDLVFHEIGMAYLEIGIGDMNNQEESQVFLENAVQNFVRSIRINPVNQYSHYYLGETLLYLNLISATTEFDFNKEYKKAARLVSNFNRIYYEVGKQFLSRWSKLSEDDKVFTLDIVQKIWEGKDREKILSILHIWNMNVNDYRILNRIIPEEIYAYRIYAEFLGEKSLSVEERQKYLSKAEYMEYQIAKREFDAGENDFFYYNRLRNASIHFHNCIKLLEKILFYQDIVGENLINKQEFLELQKSALLYRAKCRIEGRQEWSDFEEDLRDYLLEENRVSAVGELENYLIRQGIIEKQLMESSAELARISFQLQLWFKQNRFRDIIKVGRTFSKNFVLLPDEKTQSYIEIMKLMGDSFHKIDYLYDAADYYEIALEQDPDNLNILLKAKQNLTRLNDEVKLIEINRKIENLVIPGRIVPRNPVVNKGKLFILTMDLDGREIVLDTRFASDASGIEPLITVVFNNNVVWENYLERNRISLPLTTREGTNLLRMIPVNKGIRIRSFFWK